MLNVVKKAEEILLKKTETGEVNKEYNRIDGLPGLAEPCQKLIFGVAEPDENIASVQTLSGTGASTSTAAALTVEARPSRGDDDVTRLGMTELAYAPTSCRCSGRPNKQYNGTRVVSCFRPQSIRIDWNLRTCSS